MEDRSWRMGNKGEKENRTALWSVVLLLFSGNLTRCEFVE